MWNGCLGMVCKLLAHISSSNTWACWCGSMQRLAHMHRLGASMWHGDCGNLYGMPQTKELCCNRYEHNLSSKGLDVWAQHAPMQQHVSLVQVDVSRWICGTTWARLTQGKHGQTWVRSCKTRLGIEMSHIYVVSKLMLSQIM